MLPVFTTSVPAPVRHMDFKREEKVSFLALVLVLSPFYVTVKMKPR